MKLYHQVERVFNELQEMGLNDEDAIAVDQLTPFDQYHYEGTDAVDHAILSLGLNSKSHVLEVGAGIGGPARYLAANAGCKVTAMELQGDLNDVAASLTQRCQLGDKINHLQGDFLADTLPNNQYDAIVSWLVFLHIPEREKLFKRCLAATRSGGKLFIEDFSKRAEFSEQEKDELAKKVYCTYVPTAEEYSTQLEDAGFEDVQVTDMTNRWKEFVSGRLQMFRDQRERNLRVHGTEIVDGLEDFYSTVSGLYDGGNLGGVRIVATKP
ncbi:MAG: methyltransferase domain-containing protein [Gammaproteobacteria bacterium]|nr:methyltransferase domain-containing protein [Gammaproteobacteria bacterium]